MKITLLLLHEAYSEPRLFSSAAINKKDEYSVWLVPGSLSDEGSVDDELAKRGVRLSHRVSADCAEKDMSDFESKFSIAGFEIVREGLSND